MDKELLQAKDAIFHKHSEANRPFEELLADFNKNKAYVKNGKNEKISGDIYEQKNAIQN